jgi:hypothetical protein
MASPDEHTLTFLRGSGFLLSLVGVWDLMADASSPWPSQKGFLIFNETKIIAVIERREAMRRGIEGTYAVEGNRIVLTELLVDTAPEQGVLGDGDDHMALDASDAPTATSRRYLSTPRPTRRWRGPPTSGDL